MEQFESMNPDIMKLAKALNYFDRSVSGEEGTKQIAEALKQQLAGKINDIMKNGYTSPTEKDRDGNPKVYTGQEAIDKFMEFAQADLAEKAKDMEMASWQNWDAAQAAKAAKEAAQAQAQLAAAGSGVAGGYSYGPTLPTQTVNGNFFWGDHYNDINQFYADKQDQNKTLANWTGGAALVGLAISTGIGLPLLPGVLGTTGGAVFDSAIINAALNIGLKAGMEGLKIRLMPGYQWENPGADLLWAGFSGSVFGAVGTGTRAFDTVNSALKFSAIYYTAEDVSSQFLIDGQTLDGYWNKGGWAQTLFKAGVGSLIVGSAGFGINTGFTITSGAQTGALMQGAHAGQFALGTVFSSVETLFDFFGEWWKKSMKDLGKPHGTN
ncbi:MAG: hypothetical protein HPY53_00325 [Brevinematales bacterium]|nr:hypothetical protein [Brevinematales bacterium]